MKCRWLVITGTKPLAGSIPAPERRGRARMSWFRIFLSLTAAAIFAGLAVYAVPRGLEARSLIAIEDDPVQIADRALDKSFDAARAQKEIESALDTKDADLAKSFVELAHDRNVTVDPALEAKVNAADAEAASAKAAAESFALGLATGEPTDAASLAGTTVGDLFVFGDVRDAVRESARLVTGEKADELVLGLACVGLAITAGTYASLGIAAPARVGISVAKAARKSGKLGVDMAEYIGRALRQVVDWSRVKTALAGASITQPAAAIRAAREAVKVNRAGGLLRLVRDVGRVQSKAGTQAALDALKVAENPRELSRVARLAEKEGGKTRAILKVVGRGAIALTFAVFDLGVWILGALITAFGFVSSLKGATERVTLRVIRRRKDRRAARFAAIVAR